MNDNGACLYILPANMTDPEVPESKCFESYMRKRELKHQDHHKSVTLLGYIAHFSGCLSCDIDIDIPLDLKSLYSGCVKTEYECANIDPETLECGPVEKRTAYRARLKGIYSLCKREKGRGKEKAEHRRARDAIDQWRKLTSGNFICSLGEVDSYDRILVEIFDPVTGESVNEFLLKNYPLLFQTYGDYSSTCGMT